MRNDLDLRREAAEVVVMVMTTARSKTEQKRTRRIFLVGLSMPVTVIGTVIYEGRFN